MKRYWDKGEPFPYRGGMLHPFNFEKAAHRYADRMGLEVLQIENTDMTSKGTGQTYILHGVHVPAGHVPPTLWQRVQAAWKGLL